MTLDGTDLSQYRMTTTPGAEERRALNGVSILLRKATIVSEKEKVPMQAVVAPDGAVVEMSYGSAMIARAEPKSVAERLDRVEIFGLTRLVLPAPPPAAARKMPGEWTLVVSGFPDKFHRPTDRQSYRDLAGEQDRGDHPRRPARPGEAGEAQRPSPPGHGRVPEVLDPGRVRQSGHRGQGEGDRRRRDRRLRRGEEGRGLGGPRDEEGLRGQRRPGHRRAANAAGRLHRALAPEHRAAPRAGHPGAAGGRRGLRAERGRGARRSTGTSGWRPGSEPGPSSIRPSASRWRTRRTSPSARRAARRSCRCSVR